VVPDFDGQVEEEADDKRDLMDRMIDKSDEAEVEVAAEADVEREAPAAEAPETEMEAEAQREAAEADDAPDRPEGQAPA
jgi:hypothetical protein